MTPFRIPDSILPFRNFPLIDGMTARIRQSRMWVQVLDRTYDVDCPHLHDELFTICVFDGSEMLVGRLREREIPSELQHCVVEDVARRMRWWSVPPFSVLRVCREERGERKTRKKEGVE